MDVHSPEQRSFNMSGIRGKDTRPEMLVRKWLWKNGYRYRLHSRRLPGKPDIVLSKYRAVIFVHGCFWHRHGCAATTVPESNTYFWRRKFDENIARDQRNIEALQGSGWRVRVVWECTITGKGSDPDKTMEFLNKWLLSDMTVLSE